MMGLVKVAMRLRPSSRAAKHRFCSAFWLTEELFLFFDHMRACVYVYLYVREPLRSKKKKKKEQRGVLLIER